MKINDKFFNFDRCLKFVFSSGAVNGTLTVEYCPRKDPKLCPRLEAQIKDMPSPSTKDRPGYSATLTIYNPGHELLRTVANSCAWITDYTNSANGESRASEVSGGAVQKYYQHKLFVEVYAGYFKEDIKNNMGTEKNPQYGDGDYGDAPIMAGVVNNSYFFRKGHDNVLVLYAHDIDFTSLPKTVTNIGALAAKDASTAVQFEENATTVRGKPTFDLTIKNLIAMYEDKKRVESGDNSSGMWTDVLATERTPNAGWFRVLYVQSPQAYYDFIKGNPSLKGGGNEIEDPNLAARLKDPTVANRMYTEGWYTTASDLHGMLNDLCSYGGFRLGWKEDRIYATKLTYIVYELGNATKKWTLPNKGSVQIWNYQNLVEMPTIDGSGSMNIKMWFNRKCAPWAYIGLRFAQQTGTDEKGNPIPVDGLFVDPSKTGMLFNGDKLIGGIGGKAQNPAVATTQLSGSAAISGVLAGSSAIKNSGYMFNHDWLIVTVVHDLSTHGNQWTTQVRTAPLFSGTFVEKRS